MHPAALRSRLRLPLAACGALIMVALTAGCGGHHPQGSLTAPRAARAERRASEARDRELQARTFEFAWKRIGETYPHADFRGVDWQAVHDELIGRARRCRSADELRPVLAAMLSRLGESHFQVLPGDRARPRAAASSPTVAVLPGAAEGEADVPRGDLGMDVRRIGDEFVVTRVTADGPADSAGVATGWSVLALDDTHASDVIRRISGASDSRVAAQVGWAVMHAAMQGQPGSEASVQLREADDTIRTRRIARRAPPGEATRLGNLPPLVAEFDHAMLPERVGYIRFSMFLAPVAKPFSDAVREFIRDGARGVIIDLRGNPGGVGGLVMGMGGHFVREPGTSLGTMKTRESQLEFVANPRGPGAQFDGPVAILVDGLSLSTAEMFAAGLQHVRGARLFGQRTGGMALPSVIEILPNGDKMQFAIADLLAPDGQRIEGRGVQPDVEVPLRKQDLLEGKDATLDAALDWIASMTAPQPPPGT